MVEMVEALLQAGAWDVYIRYCQHRVPLTDAQTSAILRVAYWGRIHRPGLLSLRGMS